MALLEKCLTGIALATLAASTAAASTVVIPGPGDIKNDENVLFSSSRYDLLTTGLVVQGVTNQSELVVDFYDATDATGKDVGLKTVAKGQSRISAGSTEIVAAKGYFATITIGMHDPSLTFGTLMFNLDVVDGNKGGTLQIQATGMDGHTRLLTDATGNSIFGLDDKGQNFFRIETFTGDALDTVRLVSTAPVASLSDIQQVRIGGIAEASIVPLPAAALSGGAMLAVGAMGRAIRRRNA